MRSPRLLLWPTSRNSCFWSSTIFKLLQTFFELPGIVLNFLLHIRIQPPLTMLPIDSSTFRYSWPNPFKTLNINNSVQGSDINNSAATTRLCMKVGVSIMLPRNLNQEEGLRKSYRSRSVCADTKKQTITDLNQTSIHSKKPPVSSTYILGILTLPGSRD